MSRIKNLVDAGFITRTGLVDSEIAEAWTITQMFLNGTITKTGLNPEDLEKIADGGESYLPDPEYGQLGYVDISDLKSFYIQIWYASIQEYVPIRWTWKLPEEGDDEYRTWTPDIEDGAILMNYVNGGLPGIYDLKIQAYIVDEETHTEKHSHEVKKRITVPLVMFPYITQEESGDPVTITCDMKDIDKLCWKRSDQDNTHWTDYTNPLTLKDIDNTEAGGTYSIDAYAMKTIDGYLEYSDIVSQEVSF